MNTLTPETIIIGSKFWGHDSSVFMVMPKEKRVAALQTERVTRYKHDRAFAVPALTKLIEREGIDASSVKHVVFCNSFKVLQEAQLPENMYEIEMLFRKHFRSPYHKDVEAARGHFNVMSKVAQVWDLFGSIAGWQVLLQKSLLTIRIKKVRPLEDIERALLTKLFPNANIDIRFYEHEYTHASCAALTAPFSEALVWSFDGWGDKLFSQVYTFRDNTLQLVAQSPSDFVASDLKIFPNFLPSLGGIYSYFTAQLGFVPEADEGKVEALAAYGKPILSLLAELHDLVSVDSNLSMAIDRTKVVVTLADERFKKLLEEHSKEDISATVQKFLEEVTLAYVPKLVEKTGIKNIVLAGGVAANVINNLSIYEHISKHIHITPAMGDDGSAQGAAFAHLMETGVDSSWIKKMEMPYYETQYSKAEVEKVLQNNTRITYKDLGDTWPEQVGQMLVSGKIGAIFHGRAEWGPRALGHRSIVADTRRKDFRDVINKTIKKRPLFQPFCPSMLAEEKDRLFESAYLNKHMTTAFRLKKEFWDVLPSAIHIDGTARVQFVEEKDDANYYRLLKKVKELTGYGVVINTSFNKHGRTIVESPQDAIQDFLDTDMDYVVIEGFLVNRK